MFIYPYRKGSVSVSGLKDSLKAKIIKLDGSSFKGSSNKNVVNWGNSTINDEIVKCHLLNHPDRVKYASNKLNFFKEFSGKIDLPPYTTSREEAFKWIENGDRVCARTKLTGHSGEGLTILRNSDEWEEYDHADVRMYVLYIPKIDEYRIHVFNGEVIDIQKKSTPKGRKAFSYEIRSHDNGFIFTRGNIPKDMTKINNDCIEAVKVIGLDFGAVDVIYNKRRDKHYLLEINTAPGLTGTTLHKYAEAFGKYFGIPYQNNVENDVVEVRDDAPLPFYEEGALPVAEGMPRVGEPDIVIGGGNGGDGGEGVHRVMVRDLDWVQNLVDGEDDVR